MSSAPIKIMNDDIQAKVGEAKFYSITYRLFKLASLDDQEEDYGQSASYQGSLKAKPSLIDLDDSHSFEVGRPERVSANTAAMLSETRYGKHFKITGEKKVHFGGFNSKTTMAAQQYKGASKATSCG